ncbi:MAG: hypothetical protein K2X32_06340 [Phycisphaerales bacterium]|nr:hypothetical protein [Phycisphaerales bacterium]
MYLTAIRTAVLSALTGLVTTGPRVFDQEPYDLADLPCLVVATSSPAVAPTSIDVPETLQVDVEVRIETVAAASTGNATLHDTMAAEVIVALSGGVLVQGQSRPMTLAAIEAPEVTGDGDRPTGRRVLTFNCGPLFVRADAPAALI